MEVNNFFVYLTTCYECNNKNVISIYLKMRNQYSKLFSKYLKYNVAEKLFFCLFAIQTEKSYIKTPCVGRELNPDRLLGRQPC